MTSSRCYGSSRTSRPIMAPPLWTFLFLSVCGSSMPFVDGLALSNLLPSSIVSIVTPQGRQREALKKELFELVEKSSPPGNPSGRFDNSDDGDRFFEIFTKELPALNPTPNPAQSSLFSGEWECIWTSEKEINFLVKAGLFGDSWQRTYQKIDIPNNLLENFLEFDNNGGLSVGSYINPQPKKGDRFDIQFQDAVLKWKGFTLNLPPVGSGWGELLYLDETIRLQRDIRGDLILAKRVVWRWW